MRTITKRRAIGFGLSLTSTVLLITACTGLASPTTPAGTTASQGGAATPDAPVGAHGDHGTAQGWENGLARVKQETARFHTVEAAAAAGYELGYVNGAGVRIITGCVAHPTAGAMGYHYFNRALMDDVSVDPLKPEALVYAPGPNGTLQLAAVEYVVRGLASNPPGIAQPPIVFGRNMAILVPAVGFHTLHAWIWRHNPAGMFAHWNPEIACP